VAGSDNRTAIPRGKTITKSQPEQSGGTDIMKQPPGVLFAPKALTSLLQGVDTIVNTVRPTLGPTPHIVAMDRVFNTNSRPPELLDDAATISRRMIEIPGVYVNPGAMMVRHILWNVYEQVGDGSATAAVIMQALIKEGVRLSAAGWNTMPMRRGIELGLERAVAELQTMVHPIVTEADVAGLALAASQDPKLAKILGEVFDTLGSDGHVEVQGAYTPGIRHEYIEGAYWNTGWVSSSMATNEARTEAKLADAYVLISRSRIESYEDIAQLLEAAAKESHPLFITALDISGTALNVLLANQEKLKAVAVKAPSFGDHMENNLEDMAILTGTRVYRNDLGESLSKLKLSDLGRARSITVNREYTGILGGSGDAKQLRERIASLRVQIKNTNPREAEIMKQLRERLGKLVGGIAVLYVADMTESESETHRETVTRTVNTIRHAQMGGIVPGGGIALLRCARVLRDLKLPADQAVGVEALARALEEPLRAIARNGGYDEGPVVARAHKQREGWGFNALTGEFEDLRAAGIVDPLPVVQTALEKAVSGAIMILTTSVTVHRKAPPTESTP
jgi:chaperonin GroEL